MNRKDTSEIDLLQIQPTFRAAFNDNTKSGKKTFGRFLAASSHNFRHEWRSPSSPRQSLSEHIQRSPSCPNTTNHYCDVQIANQTPLQSSSQSVLYHFLFMSPCAGLQPRVYLFQGNGMSDGTSYLHFKFT